MRIVAEVVIINFAAAGERPPHKETRAYGCCVSTLTRFARSPLQRPLTGSRRDRQTASQLYAGRRPASKDRVSAQFSKQIWCLGQRPSSIPLGRCPRHPFL